MCRLLLFSLFVSRSFCWLFLGMHVFSFEGNLRKISHQWVTPVKRKLHIEPAKHARRKEREVSSEYVLHGVCTMSKTRQRCASEELPRWAFLHIYVFMYFQCYISCVSIPMARWELCNRSRNCAEGHAFEDPCDFQSGWKLRPPDENYMTMDRPSKRNEANASDCGIQGLEESTKGMRKGSKMLDGKGRNRDNGETYTPKTKHESVKSSPNRYTNLYEITLVEFPQDTTG